jgi:hypothetical protein
MHFLGLLLFLLVLGLVSPVLGQMMHEGIGVSDGDSFSYSYLCYFDSDDPSFNMPPDFSWIKQTQYYMMNVTGTSGQVVNYDTHMYFVNGTNIAGNGYLNMQDGVNSMMSGYNPMSGTYGGDYFFMQSNVGMMGRMYPSAANSPTVNDTVTRSYPDGERTLNHMSLILNQNGDINQTDYYFDQATGAMVEWRQQYIQTQGDLQANSTQVMQLTQSTAWAVPEFPAFVVIPLVCAMTAIALYLKTKSGASKLKANL